MAKPIISNNGLDPLKDLVNTGLWIEVTEKNGDKVISPFLIKNTGERFYINKKFQLAPICTPFEVVPSPESSSEELEAILEVLELIKTNTDTTNTLLQDQIEILTNLLNELKNDDYFQDTLWEDPTGLVVIKRVVKNDDGTITTEFLNANGSPYLGTTSDLVPYSRQTIITETDYCSNDIPFTLIQFRDHDTKLVVATIWRNDNTLSESVTAPADATKGICVAAAACKENKTYQIKGTQTITFEANKIYEYKAGVWNDVHPPSPLTGEVSLEEAAGVVQKYGFGDSFGNGIGDTLLPNEVIISGLDSDADVRISVIQECGYNPIIN